MLSILTSCARSLKARHGCSPFVKPDLVTTWDAGTPWVSTEQSFFSLGYGVRRMWISMEPTLAPPSPPTPSQGTMHWLLQVSLQRNKNDKSSAWGQGCHTKDLSKEWSRRQPGSPTQAQPTDTCQCLACSCQFGPGPALEPEIETC